MYLSILPAHLSIGVTQAPILYDSAGILHALPRFRIPMCATWARLFDTNVLERRAGKQESYWPVGVNEKTFMCLILKVSSRGSHDTGRMLICFIGKTRLSRFPSSHHPRVTTKAPIQTHGPNGSTFRRAVRRKPLSPMIFTDLIAGFN